MIDWEELVRREGSALWRTAYRLLRNRADADECFQEVFLAALQVSHRQPVRNWPALLQRLATARAIDRVRKRLRRRPYEEIADLSLAEAAHSDPSQPSEAAELNAALRWALAQLPRAPSKCSACTNWKIGAISKSPNTSARRSIPSACYSIEHVKSCKNSCKCKLDSRPRSSSNDQRRSVAMSEIRNHQPPDLLVRAIAATRALPLPEGPSPEVAARVSANLRAAAHEPAPHLLERIYHMPWTSKASALLGIAASMLVLYFVLSNLPGAARAFDQVADAINNVKTATWKVSSSVKMSAGETLTSAAQGMFLAPSHERTESTVHGQKSIQIIDGQQSKMIVLVPADKSAMVVDLKNIPAANPLGKTFLGFRDLVTMAQTAKGEKVERLPDETIGGRPAQRYRLQFGALEVKLWADAATSLPIRVEESTTGSPEVHLVMSDFQIDVPLDKSLFSLDLPEGYTVKQSMQFDLSKKPIQYLADALKTAADFNGGVFPPDLRGKDGVDGILQRGANSIGEKYGQNPDQLSKATMDLGAKLGGALGLIFSLSPDENDWHYAGKDVKLNTPDQPIFWYKPFKSSATYEVLFADLSVKQLPPEELPKSLPIQHGSK